MRRLILIALNSLAVLSLAMAVGALALRHRSYAVHDQFIWLHGPDSKGLVNCDGVFQFKTLYNERWPETGHVQLPANTTGRWEHDDDVIQSISFMGVGWHSGGAMWEGSWHGTAAPPKYFFTTSAFSIQHSTLALVLFAPAVPLVMQRLHATRRYAKGQCMRCGYDLCATPDRCPECGMLIKRPTAI